MVDIDGNVVGINTWIASPSGGIIGIGFAIPVNVAKQVIDEIIDNGHVSYGWLGVSIGDLGELMRSDLGIGDTEGSMVFSIVRDSPADATGILPGDFITTMGGRAVNDSADLTVLVGHLKPGEIQTVDLIRDGRPTSRDAKITVRDDTPNSGDEASEVWPGIMVVAVTDEMRDEFGIPVDADDVIVVAVQNASPSNIAGIGDGDIVRKIGSRQITSVREFYDALNAQNEQKIDFTVNRRGTIVTIGITK